MVKGLNHFREWFSQYSGQYVLIGGTAASLTMESAGLPFRSTKDLDIVLHIEALTPASVRHSGGLSRRVTMQSAKQAIRESLFFTDFTSLPTRNFRAWLNFSPGHPMDWPWPRMRS